MGRSADWLSAEGVSVLGWVNDGCPDRGTTTEEIGRRVTASALARRGLISVTGGGGSWAASITQLGLAWLAAHPQPSPPDAVGEDGDLAHRVSDLIARVVADGRFSIPDGEESRALNGRLVELSHSAPDRPGGYRLRLRKSTWYHGSEVVLVRYAGDLGGLPPVPIPEHVAKYHPAVRTFVDHRSGHIGTEHRSRAARILQAIAHEAPRRGIAVSPPDAAGRNLHERRADEIRRGHLVLRTSAGFYWVRIEELAAPGKLELIMEGPGTDHRGDRYRDSVRTTVEARLPGLFQDLETHRVEIERREQERQRREHERQRQWEAAMAEARRGYDEQQRWGAFERSSRDWRAATEHREFLVVAREAAQRHDGPDRDDLMAHLDFVARRLAALDPLGDIRTMVPVVPEPKPEDLKPFLWQVEPIRTRDIGLVAA